MINQSNGGRYQGFLRALFAASAVLAAGCDLSTGEVNSGLNQFVRVHNPVGHVQGIVTDTNGTPIKGAKVATGRRTTTTDASGTYVFRDLEVVNATTNNTSSDNNTDHGNLRLVITPPKVTNQQTTTYLGAIVEVYPEAQFNSTNQQFNDENQALNQGSSQAVFIDGFRIEADHAVLPALNSTIEILALRDGNTGQLVPSGTEVTLDYDGISSNNEDTGGGNDITYQNVNWSTTVAADGSVTFNNVADESDFEMHVRRYSCNNDTNNADTGNTCGLSSANETNVVTYENYNVWPLTDAGDNIDPFPISVTGVYESDPPMFNTACFDVDGDDVGLLTRGIDGTAGIRINFNENVNLDAAGGTGSVAVYDVVNETYVPVSAVTVSGSTVNVTTASAIAAGTEFDVFLFRPDFTDDAGNVIYSDNETDYDCDDIAGNWVGYVAVSLHTFSQPVTAAGMVAALQTEEDPVDSGDDNDAPYNQTLSSAFRDVDDESAGDDDDIQQMNASNQNDIDNQLENRANAFASIDAVDDDAGNIDVDTDVVRIEFAPLSGVTQYRITRNGDSDIEIVTVNDFDNEYLDSYTDNADADTDTDVDGDTLLVQTLADGTLAFTLDGTDEGDVITVEGYDDLGKVGDAASVIVVDNVRPTVGIQHSYQAHININGNSVSNVAIHDDDEGENLSGCFVHNPGSPIEHAGIAITSSTGSFGNGGELSDPGAAGSQGNLCIGVSPELLVDADEDSATAHTELEAGRAAEFDAQASNVASWPRAYDGAAFTAWARPVVKWGVAWTEDLAETLTGAPVDTATAIFSNWAVQNNTAGSHLGGPDIGDLTTADISDAYVLANTDHGQTIDFAGTVSDLAGNVADASVDAELTLRDQWPPYVVTGSQRNADGTLTIETDTPVIFEDGAVTNVTLQDDSGTATIPLIVDVDGDPVNFSQAGTTITVQPYWSGGAPNPRSLAEFDADYQGLFDDDVANPMMWGAPATQYAILSTAGLYDERGNRWLDHLGNVDLPQFIFPDALVTFVVNADDGGIAAVDTAATFDWTANHEICNVSTDAGYTSGVDNVPSDCSDATSLLLTADFDTVIGGDDDTVPECVEAVDGSITCDKDTVDAIMAGSVFNTCDLTAAGGSASLTVNAAHTVIQIELVCGAGDFTATNLQFTLSADTFSSAWDGDTDISSNDVNPL